MPRIITNRLKSNDCTLKTDGKFVVPCVLVVEGVLNGGLLTFDQIAKSLYAWNGKPVVISHPSDEAGAYMSAISPEVYDKQLIGFVFNPRIEGDRLLGDLHLDEKMICKAGHCELSERLKRGEVIEVSTGYMCDVEQTPGNFNGTDYSEIQKNIEPDHLAVLVDEIGACSIADGCGTNRANKRKRTNKQNKGATMSKQKIEEMAKKLKANEKLTAEQFDLIMAMDEEQAKTALMLLDAQASAAPAEPETPEAPVAMAEEDVKKLEEVVANRVINAIDEVLERRDIVRTITANSDMTAEELKPMAIEVLRKMAANTSGSSTDYSGQNGFGKSQEKEVIVNASNAPIPMGIVRRTK